MTDAEKIANTVAAHEAADQAELEKLRAMSIEERGRMIQAACRAAWEIHCSRIRAGLPPIPPDPWPESTIEFMRKHAAKFRKAGES
ncbi:MAG: hypothetical protein HYS13_05735 [Planctomycetia bacterium]|nr:hypothetical protein [Planctomycetia bacterium]